MSNTYKDRAVEVLRAIAELLDDVPHVMFCAKDESGAYLAVNQAFADRAGARDPDDVIGRYVEDLFDAELAASYPRQDADLWSSRRPLRNQLELISRPGRNTRLVCHDQGADLRGRREDPFSPAFRWTFAPPAMHPPRMRASPPRSPTCARTAPRQVRVGDVAAAASMSVVQLERATRRIVGLSVRQLLVRFRVEYAIGLLATTDLALSDVAERCGYYDQSAFTAAVSARGRRLTGCIPDAGTAALTSPDAFAARLLLAAATIGLLAACGDNAATSSDATACHGCRDDSGGHGHDGGRRPAQAGGQTPRRVPTELVITDLTEGTGAAAVDGDTLIVHYVGVRSVDGAEFDNSFDRGPRSPSRSAPAE